MVKVLVGERGERAFEGFWAEFEGEEISRHETEDGVVYALYKCTAYNWDAYRVHVLDETDSGNPKYELHPYTMDERRPERGPDYTEPYDPQQLPYAFPIFVKEFDILRTRRIDPNPRW